jgi:hypothetical protein
MVVVLPGISISGVPEEKRLNVITGVTSGGNGIGKIPVASSGIDAFAADRWEGEFWPGDTHPVASSTTTMMSMRETKTRRGVMKIPEQIHQHNWLNIL